MSSDQNASDFMDVPTDRIQSFGFCNVASVSVSLLYYGLAMVQSSVLGTVPACELVAI